jgi:hypothetical protein
MPADKKGGVATPDKPSVLRHFDLPKGLNDSLKSTARAEGKSDVAIVRDAITAYAVRGGLTDAEQQEQIKKAVLSALKEAGVVTSPGALPDGVVIKVTDEQRAELSTLSKSLHVKEPELLSGLVRTILKLPRELVEEFLFGNAERMIAARAERSVAAGKTAASQKARRDKAG